MISSLIRGFILHCDCHVAHYSLRNGLIRKQAFWELPKDTSVNVESYSYFRQKCVLRVSLLQETISKDLLKCGLHSKTLDQLSQVPTLGKSSLRSLEMKDYAYAWKS